MSETFELHICDADGGRRMMFVSCQAEDVVRVARLRLLQHAAAAVEVWKAGEHLATLESQAPRLGAA